VQDFVIREAILDDLPELLAFEQALIKAERPFDPTLKEGEIHYYNIREMILAPHIYLIVAVTDNRLIASGYARIDKAQPYLEFTHFAYLGFMYVDPAYRSQGINGKIMEVLKQWAIKQELTELRLEVYDENISAIKAYAKAGFSRLKLEMRMRLKE
jgi:ribosomal protein S18 acetylase RimI-like enzyme